MITDRLSGAFFFIAGLALYFYVIPNFVDRIDYGAIHPETMPNALAILLAVSGAALIIRPTKQHPIDLNLFLRASLFLAVLFLGVFAMSKFGFLYVASPLALVIMLLIGERRPAWIAAGVVVMPFLIWIAIEVALDRNLP